MTKAGSINFTVSQCTNKFLLFTFFQSVKHKKELDQNCTLCNCCSLLYQRTVQVKRIHYEYKDMRKNMDGRFCVFQNCPLSSWSRGKVFKKGSQALKKQNKK